MRIDFYHLQNQTLEDVLPKLVEKAYATGQNIVIKIGTPERVEFLNSHLWSYEEGSFLPHGTKKDGNADLQPIWLTAGDEIPNQANIMFWVDGAQADIKELNGIERILNIFDGNSETALQQARHLWKELKSSGCEVHYWQQENNRWQQKA